MRWQILRTYLVAMQFLTPNEIRGIIDSNPQQNLIDELRNKNMPIEDSHTQAKIGVRKTKMKKNLTFAGYATKVGLNA